MSERRMSETLSVAKYGGNCTECKTRINKNSYIWYDTIKRTIRHRECVKEKVKG